MFYPRTKEVLVLESRVEWNFFLNYVVNNTEDQNNNFPVQESGVLNETLSIKNGI